MEGNTQATLEAGGTLCGGIPLLLRPLRRVIELQLLLLHLAAVGLVDRMKPMVKLWSLMPTSFANMKHRLEDRM